MISMLVIIGAAGGDVSGDVSGVASGEASGLASIDMVSSLQALTRTKAQTPKTRWRDESIDDLPG
jgi:hypothetical protein